MVTKRVMPVGEQSFSEVRNRGFVYVDKTQYVYQLISESKVYFLGRPRRFGKSLLLSTLKSYFLGEKELFEGLYLGHAEPDLAAAEGRPAWQEYPVFYFSLASERYVDEQALKGMLNQQLVQYEKRYGREPEDNTLSNRVRGIIRRACEQTTQQVVVLIDEYDRPLLATLHNPELHQTYKEILHAFYLVLKDSSDYLRFVFLTGVTRFSKVGIFSGLNNLKDLSMLPAYAGVCGITERELEANFAPEIESLAAALKLSREKTLAKLKKRYDGYLFNEQGEHVYNPFSLLSVFSANYFSDYWYTTGTPTFLVEKLKAERFRIPDFGNGLSVRKREMENYSTESEDVVPILFQAGYLTIKSYLPQREAYVLGFPNDEVKYSFLENLMPLFYKKNSPFGTAVWDFQDAIEAGNVEAMMRKIEALLASVPYDNINDVEYRERDAQLALFFIFTLLGELVEAEVHNNLGRADIIVHTDEIIYIFELKLWSAGTPDDDIAQIKEQGYATPYLETDKKVLLIGASFDEEKRNVGAWKVEELGG